MNAGGAVGSGGGGGGSDLMQVKITYMGFYCPECNNVM